MKRAVIKGVQFHIPSYYKGQAPFWSPADHVFKTWITDDHLGFLARLSNVLLSSSAKLIVRKLLQEKWEIFTLIRGGIFSHGLMRCFSVDLQWFNVQVQRQFSWTWTFYSHLERIFGGLYTQCLCLVTSSKKFDF